MKKLFMLIAIVVVLNFHATAFAQGGDSETQKDGYYGNHQGGGFQGDYKNRTVTVSEALKLPDDTWVTLVGKITNRVGHEKYQFSDGTKTIIVEIDDDDWHGLVVKPEDTVEITGEIDKDFGSIEIDVEYILKR